MATESIKIINAALDEWNGDILLRGVVDPSSLAHLKVDDYQREILPQSRIKELARAIKSGKVPDIELGMRGGSFLDGFPCSGRKTYAYRKEYNPLPCGWGELELEIGREYLQYVGGKNIYTPWKVRMSKGSIVAG